MYFLMFLLFCFWFLVNERGFDLHLYLDWLNGIRYIDIYKYHLQI